MVINFSRYETNQSANAIILQLLLLFSPTHEESEAKQLFKAVNMEPNKVSSLARAKLLVEAQDSG